jgi:RecB family exonuclease
MSYLDRPAPPKGPPWAHNSLGASVHNALAGWWRLPLPRRTVQAAGALVTQGWIGEGFTGAEQSARYRDWARSLVEEYVSGLDPADEPVGVERTVATRTDKIAVSGRIDRLDARPRSASAEGDSTEGTELVVVDYKTGRHLLSVDDARSSLALAIYALAASRALRRDCQRVELHHLPSGQVLAWEHTDESLKRHLRRAEDTAAECADADERMRAPLPREKYDEVFPPRTGPACGWCDYLRSCPEGQTAAAAHRPWDALAELLSHGDDPPYPRTRATGTRRYLEAFGRVPELGEGVSRGGGGLDVGVMRRTGDTGALRAETCCHLPLLTGWPGIIVLAVQDEGRDVVTG